MNQHRQKKHKSQDKKKQPEIDVSEVNFKVIASDLFSEVAEKIAETIGDSKSGNKMAQVRRFYDEIIMWDQKVMKNRTNPEKFQQYLPFIRMLNAKAAHARGRKLVDDNYVKLMSKCLQQVDDVKTMHTFKVFMEAFMGFYKKHGPSN